MKQAHMEPHTWSRTHGASTHGAVLEAHRLDPAACVAQLSGGNSFILLEPVSGPALPWPVGQVGKATAGFDQNRTSWVAYDIPSSKQASVLLDVYANACCIKPDKYGKPCEWSGQAAHTRGAALG